MVKAGYIKIEDNGSLTYIQDSVEGEEEEVA